MINFGSNGEPMAVQDVSCGMRGSARLRQIGGDKRVPRRPVCVTCRPGTVRVDVERNSTPLWRSRSQDASGNSSAVLWQSDVLPGRDSDRSGIDGTQPSLPTVGHRMWDIEVSRRRKESRSHILQVEEQVTQLIKEFMQSFQVSG